MEVADFQTLSKIKTQIANGDLSCEQLVNAYLQKIEQTNHLNIYVEVFGEEAIQRAKALDIKYKEQPESVGSLFGMVVAIKDVLCYAGHQVTASSKILEGFESQFSATAIERLIQEDAIIIGRVNCDEFAMGSTNETSIYGPTLNAADEQKVPGGSSGGSAVAVQANTCLVSLGSDTGGSVRQPAAFCGNIGFKPTYGRISRHGLLAYASSFDQIGIFSNTVEDVAQVLEVMAGYDEYDATVSQKDVPAYSKSLDFGRKAKIAYFESALYHERLDEDIKTKTLGLIQQMEAAGHQVEAVDFKYLDFLIPTYYVLTTAEASSNLARYDGIRYGYRSKDATDLLETYTKSRTEGFGTEVKRRIMLGTFVLSAGYYDAYYTKAQKVRRLIVESINQIFENYDFILMPTTPAPAFNLGESLSDPLEMYLADIFTVLANLAGIPGISIPLPNHKDGLPIGVQFLGKHFEEADLLAFSHHVSTMKN